MKTVVALALVLVASTVSAADWDAVQQILGRKGEVQDGVLRVNFVRSDLKVMKDDVPVSPDLVFDSWYGFWPQADGRIMLMGDTCVQESELPAVEQEIHRQGLELTALHNHLIGEKPKMMFLHLSGMGDAAGLARKVKAVLARTSTPTGPAGEEEKSATKPDWSAVTAILGAPAEREGDRIEYGFQRGEALSMHGQPLPATDALETAPEVKLQMLPDGRAITYGEMILVQNEVGPVFHALAEHGITVTALHNHMIAEEPRLFFLHWWAVGRPGDLARGIQAAVSRMKVHPEHGRE